MANKPPILKKCLKISLYRLDTFSGLSAFCHEWTINFLTDGGVLLTNANKVLFENNDFGFVTHAHIDGVEIWDSEIRVKLYLLPPKDVCDPEMMFHEGYIKIEMSCDEFFRKYYRKQNVVAHYSPVVYDNIIDFGLWKAKNTYRITKT